MVTQTYEHPLATTKLICGVCTFRRKWLIVVLQYVRLIQSSRVYDVVKETPLTYAARLSRRLQCNVWLKREDVQPIFSFKLRGAYNKMAHLSETERSRGVIACSAGKTIRDALHGTTNQQLDAQTKFNQQETMAKV